MNPDSTSSTTPTTPTAPASRRDFLSTLLTAAATAPLVTLSAQAQTGGTSANKAGAAAGKDAGKRTLGTVHVFSKPLVEFSYEETAKLLAEAGFGGIDLTVRKAQPHVLPEKVNEDLPRAVEAAHKAGLKVEMITTDITSVKEPHAETVLRAAAKAGVKVYRLGNYNYDLKLGVAESLTKHSVALKELAALNQSLGIHGAIQNHMGTRVGSPVWDLYHVLKDIDPQWVGVQYDIRHAIVEGAQSWPLGLRLLAPWIRCIDIKDFRWEQAPGKATVDNTPLGQGIVPFDAYFKLVKELGIGGPISLHLEYPPFERGPKYASLDEKRAALLPLLKKDQEFLAAQLAKIKA